MRRNIRASQTKIFPMVLGEIRRNSLGSCNYGGTVAAISAIAAAALMAMFKLYLGWSVSPLQILSFALNLVFLWYWLIVVKPDWVRDAAEAYARALLAACETTPPQRRPKPATTAAA